LAAAIGEIARPLLAALILARVSGRHGRPAMAAIRLAISSGECFRPVWAAATAVRCAADRAFPLFPAPIFARCSAVNTRPVMGGSAAGQRLKPTRRPRDPKASIQCCSRRVRSATAPTTSTTANSKQSAPCLAHADCSTKFECIPRRSLDRCVVHRASMSAEEPT
jgi:hypothetical protein